MNYSETRSKTMGNTNVDYTKIRQNLSEVSPAVAATLRNAVPRNGSTPERDEIKGKDHINPYKLASLSNIISNNINAVQDLRAITPYIDKAELIWNTILLYPNGKQDRILTRDTFPTRYKSTALHALLLKKWDNYYTNDYKIEAELGPWINDILWNTGSVTLFNLSRPGLDYLINGSEVDPNDPQARAGQEAFRNQARVQLAQEFESVNGKHIVRNKGMFVRDPGQKAVNDQKQYVSGLEALLNGRKDYVGTEFNLFNGVTEKVDNEELKVSDFMNITLTDNPAILYLQRFNETTRQQDVLSVMGMESFDNLIVSAFRADQEKKKSKDDKALERDKKKNQQAGKKTPEGSEATTQNLTEDQLETIGHTIFRGRNIRHQSMQHVKTQDSLSVQPYGRGLVWHVPSEAVIPIHYNGRTRQKIDYIFLLDDEGNFLKTSGDDSFYQSVSKNQSVQNRPKAGSDNHLISSLRQVQEGKPCEFDMSEFAEMAKSAIIRRYMQSVISNTGDNISVTIDDETNKIFLARMFRRQGIRCLYVPGEAVTYMALKYNRLGMGQSLTQMAKMHIARLAAFDFADALANLQAAQPHSLMTIDVDKLDGDPHNTIALARAAFFANNPRLHNLLSTAQLSVPQIADALRESSLTIKVNASENPNMPTPNIDLSRMDKEHFKPVDDASRQKVLNDISNYFHLPRSWLDVSDDQNEFQIEALTEHQMVHNQGANWQSELADHVIDFEKKHARVNGVFMKDLVQEIIDNKNLWKPDSKEEIPGDENQQVKIILADFFSGLFCYFPEASSTESTNKLKDNLEAVQALVTAWEELSGSSVVMGQMAKVLGLEDEKYSQDEIKASIKSVFMTEAFRRFNLPMPFDDIVNEGKGGGIASLIHNIVHQRNNVAEFVIKFLEERSKADDKTKKTYKKILEKLTAPPPPEPGQPQLDEYGNPIEPAAEPQFDDEGNVIEPTEGGGEVPGEEGSESTGVDDVDLGDGGEAPGMPGEEGGTPDAEGGEVDAGADADAIAAAGVADAPPMPGEEGTTEDETAVEPAPGEEPETLEEGGDAPPMPEEGGTEEGGDDEGSDDPESPNYNPFKGQRKK